MPSRACLVDEVAQRLGLRDADGQELLEQLLLVVGRQLVQHALELLLLLLLLRVVRPQLANLQDGSGPEPIANGAQVKLTAAYAFIASGHNSSWQPWHGSTYLNMSRQIAWTK